MELSRNTLTETKTAHKSFSFLFLFLILISFSCSMISSAGPDNRCCSSAKAGHTNLQPITSSATWKLPADGRRVAQPNAAEVVVGDHEDQELRTLARRELGGPGSSPPRCASMCGKCTPCTAVHVPVPPGTPVTAEYYPEAWRCKCGNKLYMP
ncbi:EPIDERMAL PATTERNING FACTOR-like protein 4 isoform X1 [Cucurbita maxima]|uniref:Epidermal patterning factor-like protein n=1 Tax=Cucurbita maxima TaxID=3661 RepID=A0A6J1KCE5_CUCMA|nr:EPIDERMAL PATTERNING FACTOR-like protein 4 isoform X1 [Cucurbita maxima]